MPRQYQDPRTGFIITTNDEEAHIDYKHPTYQPPTEPAPQVWGEIGQGVRGSSGQEITAENLSNFAWWQENKDSVQKHVDYLNGN